MVLGELVRLRAMGPADAEALWRWNHDPEVMRWMDDTYPQTLEQVRGWLAERPRNAYGSLLLGVEALADGALIGLVSLHDAEPEKGIAELDIYLGEKDYWGRGYATDAMRTICRYGFEDMRLHKVTLTVVTENHAARRVYEKVGFVEEGRLRQVFRRDGRWYDMYTMGLLAHELR
ncbi:GNAT family N-acetyltransferase [Allostreptomyces psammosilenae]|uniref:RimJ/RimL family protein N-acetyltransferase n=1 Tax=Allostreptomyces psammosilenae TaxID=1892865 RepID=A0A852ZYP5_9ACTN|nr:GNAT family N-acetyltransferase [Allostreptomyces psammosilenae]NYI07466.1 RimJ/RimL family protein N-acetyltransferase [Allostreptomyces psammosilenae]